MTNRLSRIRDLLTQHFAPSFLRVEDDSARHAGHAGAAPGGETHFNITIRAAAFQGLNRVACHRLVNTVLAEEFETGLHALSLKATDE